MDEFEKWLAENFSYVSPEARDSMRQGFIGGLRCAASICRHSRSGHRNSGPDAARSNCAVLIEMEAETIDKPDTP